MAQSSDSIGFVYEDVLLRIVDIPRSTRQNWVRADLLVDPADGRYRERDVIETVIVALLVRVLKQLDDVRRIRLAHRSDLIASAMADPNGRLVALVEPRLLRVTQARTRAGVGAAIRAL